MTTSSSYRTPWTYFLAHRGFKTSPQNYLTSTPKIHVGYNINCLPIINIIISSLPYKNMINVLPKFPREINYVKCEPLFYTSHACTMVKLLKIYVLYFDNRITEKIGQSLKIFVSKIKHIYWPVFANMFNTCICNMDTVCFLFASSCVVFQQTNTRGEILK